jgi:hypothetical protein
MKSINAWSVIALSLLVACSGKPPVEEVKVEKPQFKVLEAAPGGREMWLDFPQQWAEKSKLDTEKFYYYVGESRSADKRMACDKARANMIDDVGKQVVSFVDSSIARASSDSSSESTTGISADSTVSEETQKISSQITKTSVNNVRIEKQYWEKRDYSEAGGAKSIYVCWVLAAVDKKEVQNMIARANSIRMKDASLREKVGEKLKNLAQEYDEYQQNR